jgi:hypothetical protein
MEHSSIASGWVKAWEYSGSGTTWNTKGQVGVTGNPTYCNGIVVDGAKIYFSVVKYSDESSPDVYSNPGTTTWTSTSYPGASNKWKGLTVVDNVIYQGDNSGDLWSYIDGVGWSESSLVNQPYYTLRESLLSIASGNLVRY